MKNLTVMIALGAMCVIAATCGYPSHYLDDQPSFGPSPVVVEVTNGHMQDIDLYAVNGGQRWRLGTITTGETERFRVPTAAAIAGNEFALQVHPIGGGRDFFTDRVLVSAGDRVRLNVAPMLAQSSYLVFGPPRPEARPAPNAYGGMQS